MYAISEAIIYYNSQFSQIAYDIDLLEDQITMASS